MKRTIVTIAINAALRVTGIMPTCILGDAYSATVRAFGGSGSGYVFTADPGQSLPSGLTATDNGDGTYTVAGTTSVPGPVHVFGTLTDDERNGPVPYSFNFLVQPLPLTISGHIGGGLGGAAASGSYTSSGGVGTKTFTVIAGTFPTTGGLSSAGAALGNWSSPGFYSWTVRVTDSASPTPSTVDLADSCNVTYTTLTLTGTYESVAFGAYTSDLTISGGSGTYSNPHVTSGSLPSGLSLSIVGSNLRLSGTATTFGSFTATVAVDSSDGQTATSSQTVYALDLYGSGERGVWLDPSDFSTMWQDSAGTTPVTATGQSVGLIHDKSGNGNHFVQPTSGNRPVLQQDGSGKYYLQFTASNSSYLQASVGSGDGLYSGTLSISVVTGFKLDTTGGNEAIIARSFYGSYTGRWWQSAQSGGNTETGSQFTGTTTVASQSFSSTAITVCSSDLVRPTSSGTGTNTTRINASQVATASGADASGNSNPNLLTLIGVYNAANNTSPQSGFYLNGRIYELIVRIASFDSTKRSKTEDWVNLRCLAY